MLGRYSTIKDIIGRIKKFDLLPKYKFYIDMYSIFVSLYEKSKSLSSSYNLDPTALSIFKVFDEFLSFNTQADLLFLVNGVNAPELTVDSENSSSYPKINVAKTLTLNGDLSIDFYADSKDLVKKFYYAWLQLMFDMTTGMSRPKYFYEVDIPIYIYTKQDKQVEQRTYHNCSPRKMNEHKYDTENLGLQDVLTIDFNVNNNMTVDFL